MTNIHPIEQLLHATALLTVSDGKKEWIGTGFFCQFPLPTGRTGICMVSCRHVLENAEKVSFSLRQQDKHGTFVESLLTVNLNLERGATCHPDPNVDLAAFVVHHIDAKANTDEFKVFYLPFPWSSIPGQEQWGDIHVGDDVYVPGAPLGLKDHKTGLPFMRKGSIASIPKFGETPYLYIDMPTFGGQSGSPAVIQTHISYDMRAGQLEFRDRFYLVGVVTDGLQVQQENVDMDIHFGKLVRSDKIAELFDQLLLDYGIPNQ